MSYWADLTPTQLDNVMTEWGYEGTRTIQAIKKLREYTALGLKESKDAIDFARVKPWDEVLIRHRLMAYLHDPQKAAPRSQRPLPYVRPASPTFVEEDAPAITDPVYDLLKQMLAAQQETNNLLRDLLDADNP